MRQAFTTGDATAVREAAEGVAAGDGVGGVFLLIGADTSFDVATLAPEEWNLDTPVFGGVFPEVIHAGEKTDAGTVVVGLPATPELQTITGLSGADDPEITAQLDPTALERGHETAFVLVDSHADRVGEFVDRLFDTYGVEVTFVGGGAGVLSDAEAPCLFTDDGPVSDGAVVAMTPLSGSVGVHHGWEEIAGPFRVTDAEGRTVQTLDGDPAFERYRAVVADDAGEAPTRAAFFETAKAYPFGISRVGGEVVVRDPYDVGDDGSVDCFGPVPEGEFVHVLHGEPDRLVAAARRARADAGGDGTLFFFDCISRVLFLEDDFSRELAAIGGGDEPAVGALTIGEIANDGHGHLEYYNKTAVVASVGDGADDIGDGDSREDTSHA